MSDNSVNSIQFWIGTLITIVAIVVGINQTNQKISEQRNENRLIQVSEVIKDLSKSTMVVTRQLDSQASMYLEMQNCIRKSQDNISCWKNNKLFSPAESASAWISFNSTIAYSSPFMSGDKEIEILDKMKALKQIHQTRVRSLNPPDTETDANNLVTLISKSKTELIHLNEELGNLLSNRLRD